MLTPTEHEQATTHPHRNDHTAGRSQDTANTEAHATCTATRTSRQRPSQSEIFSQRLNLLFTTFTHDSGRRITQAQLTAQINSRGYRLSRAYISQLRHGTRQNPSPQLVRVIADIFEVPEDYFFIPISSADGIETNDARVLEQLRDDDIRLLLTRAHGLSTLSTELLLDMAQRLRVAEHRPDIDRCAGTRNAH